MLNKTFRIKKTEIPNVVRKGKAFRSDLFDIKAWYDNKIEHSHFAVIVSTKIDKRAVVRNTIKRKFRAAIYELNKEDFFRKGSYTFIMRKVEIQNLKSAEIKNLITQLLHS